MKKQIWRGRIKELQEDRKAKERIAKRNSIRARLSVYGMNTLDKKQLKDLKKWLERIVKEMETLEVEAYTKNPRFTLYK